MRGLTLFFLLFSLNISAQQYATISYGHRIPVHTWSGEGKTIDFAIDVLDSSDDQGILAILGRDSKSIWYIQAGYDNDASDDGWFMNLVRTDTTGKETIFPKGQSKPTDTTFAQQFHRYYDAYFIQYKLAALKPVETWMSPEPYEHVAAVNSRELNKVFYWDFLVTDDPDDGSCVFYFGWNVRVLNYQAEREIGIYEMIVSIPSTWKYVERKDSSGYIAAGSDTFYFGACPPEMILSNEKTEYRWDSRYDEDSVEVKNYDAGVRKYNDSLHKTYAMAATHTIGCVRFAYGHFVFFIPRNNATGKMLIISCGVGYGTRSYMISSTAVDAKRQKEFLEVMETRRDRS